MSDQRIEYYCELMHDAYERGAIVHGWDTNPASRHKPWAEVPEANKATMRVAVAALLDAVVRDYDEIMALRALLERSLRV